MNSWLDQFSRIDEVAEPFQQAPPFLSELIRTASIQKTNRRTDETNIDQVAFQKYLIEGNTDGEETSDSFEDPSVPPFAELVPVDWYKNSFLTPRCFDSDDIEIISNALKSDCHFENFEVDRFEYELLMNSSPEMFRQNFSRGAGAEALESRMPSTFKGSSNHLRALLENLPRTGRAPLTDLIPDGVPTSVVHKVLRWIQAFPPLHREVRENRVYICGESDCELFPLRIPGIGFVYAPLRLDSDVGPSTRNEIDYPKHVKPESATPPDFKGAIFQVFANGKLVQNGGTPKLSANPNCKHILIKSTRNEVLITRFVKTWDDATGAIEIKFSEQNQTQNVKGQLYKAWWFDLHGALVLATQKGEIFLVTTHGVKSLGVPPVSAYSLDVALNEDFTSVLFVAGSNEIWDCDLKTGSFQVRNLAPLPLRLWKPIMDLQYKEHRPVETDVSENVSQPVFSDHDLKYLGLFPDRTINSLRRAGIMTLGQLARASKQKISQEVKFTKTELFELGEPLADVLVSRLSRELTPGEQQAIWNMFKANGWLASVAKNYSYQLPKILDSEALAAATLEPKLISICAEQNGFLLLLTLGIQISVNSDWLVDGILVHQWSPNELFEQFGILNSY